MFSRQPWVCPRCNTVNAPHRDQCTCQPIAITAPTTTPQPIIEPWRPSRHWVAPYPPTTPYRYITDDPFNGARWNEYRITC